MDFVNVQFWHFEMYELVFAAVSVLKILSNRYFQV